MEKISQSLESKTVLKLENIYQTLETKIEKISKSLETLMISTSQKEIKANEITKTSLEIQIANQTQTMKTFLSDHFKFTWLPTQFKQHSLPSYNFLPLQINHPNNQILLQFDTKTINKDYFIYSNNNQTITKNSYDGNWRMIYVNKPLPKNQIISINFRIEKSKHNNASIMIGICPISILNNTGECYNTMGAYAYYGGCGYIYYNNTSIITNDKITFR